MTTIPTSSDAMVDGSETAAFAMTPAPLPRKLRICYVAQYFIIIDTRHYGRRNSSRAGRRTQLPARDRRRHQPRQYSVARRNPDFLAITHRVGRASSSRTARNQPLQTSRVVCLPDFERSGNRCCTNGRHRAHPECEYFVLAASK
jgi:hypothetical protein